MASSNGTLFLQSAIYPPPKYHERLHAPNYKGFKVYHPTMDQRKTAKLVRRYNFSRYRMYKYTYGTKWIPWLTHPMKDAQDCDMLGEAVMKRYTPRSPNGGTQYRKPVLPIWWTLAELKYLSKQGKEIKWDSRSSDERNGISLNSLCAKPYSVA